MIRSSATGGQKENRAMIIQREEVKMTRAEIIKKLRRYDAILTEAIEKEDREKLMLRSCENDRHLFRHYFGELLKKT